MKTKSAIQKGKELENWIVDRLRISGLDTRAYRQKGSGNGLNKGDVWNDLNLCIEAKNCKNFSREWFKQVKRESMGTQVPVVVWHTNQVPLDDSIVIIGWAYFEELLLKSKTPELINPDRQVAWKVKSAINSLKALLKELGE